MITDKSSSTEYVFFLIVKICYKYLIVVISFKDITYKNYKLNNI